jgi:hypothetical protein
MTKPWKRIKDSVTKIRAEITKDQLDKDKVEKQLQELEEYATALRMKDTGRPEQAPIVFDLHEDEILNKGLLRSELPFCPACWDNGKGRAVQMKANHWPTVGQVYICQCCESEHQHQYQRDKDGIYRLI